MDLAAETSVALAPFFRKLVSAVDGGGSSEITLFSTEEIEGVVDVGEVLSGETFTRMNVDWTLEFPVELRVE